MATSYQANIFHREGLILHAKPPSRTHGALGFNDQGDPNTDTELGDSSGTLGHNDGAEALSNSLLATNIRKRKSKKKPASKKNKKKSKTINIVTHFPNPLRGNTKKEIQKIMDGNWEPSSDDFDAAFRKKSLANSFLSLFGIIAREKKGSIKKINIITHSNKRYIAFSGQITSTGVSFDADAVLSEESLDLLKKDTTFEIVDRGEKKNTSILDVISRFDKDAKIVIYSCNSGLDPILSQTLANKLNVTVISFKEKIRHVVKYDHLPMEGEPSRKLRITRGIGYGLGKNGKSVKKITDLESKGTLYSPKKQDAP